MVDQITTIAPGVTREDNWWGYTLKGSKDALLAAKVAQPEWFADGIARNKRGHVIRQRCIEVDGVRVKCSQEGKRRFVVTFYYSEEETERRRLAVRARCEYEKAKAEEEKELACMPQSHEHFRRISVRYCEVLFEDRISDFFGEREYHGYSFAPEVLDAIEQKMQEIRGILETGRTLFSAERHNARIAAVKARTAEADPGFHGFLQSLKAERG